SSEDIAASLSVRQVIVHVSAAAGTVREGLGHERCDGAVLASCLARQHLEENEAIGGRQSIRVLEVHFVLGICILLARLIDPPVELAKGIVDITKIIARSSEAFEVIARFRQGIDTSWVPWLNPAIAMVNDEKVLRLNADVEDKTSVAKLTQNALQVDAGTV